METNLSILNDSEKSNVFIKTAQGIIKFDTEKIPEFLILLKEKISTKEKYRVTGIGLDTSPNESKVAERKDVQTMPVYDEPADLQSTDKINEEEQTINTASRKAKKEYDLELRNALQITAPEKRSEALQDAAENYEKAIQKAGREFISDIKKGNIIYLDYIQAIDPLHYSEIKKAVEENLKFRENVVNRSNIASIKAIQIHIDSVKAAYNFNYPEEREREFIKANIDLNNKLSTWRNIMIDLLKTLTVNIPTT